MSQQTAFSLVVLYLRSAIFWCLHIVSLIPVLLVLLLFFWAPIGVRYAIASSWAKMNMRFLKWICGLDYEIKGRQNIPAEASLVLMNHQSTWETLATQSIFPNQLWVLKKELLRVPLFGWGLALISPIAIDRKAGKKPSTRLLSRVKRN